MNGQGGRDGHGRRLAATPIGVSLVGGTALFGLLQLLTQQLSVFHLRTEVAALISALVGVLGLLITTLKARSDGREQLRETTAQLDQALAIFPPRAARHTDVFDLGVDTGARQPAADGYLKRTHDADIAQGLTRGSGVVVSGPPASGKTRSAAAVLTATLADATVLVPEDAPGLATVLAHAHRLPFEVSSPCVLWLDGLDRFLDGLEMDAIEAWLWRTPRVPGWRRLLQRWPRSRGADGSGADDQPTGPPGLRIVGTIRDEVLEDLRSGGTDAGWRLRRLLARTTQVQCPDRLDAEEQKALGESGLGPGSSTSAFAARRPPGPWDPRIMTAPHRDPPRRRVTVYVPELLVALVLVGIGVVLAWRVHRAGWTQPPSLSAQFSSLAGQTPACSSHREYPPANTIAGSAEGTVRFLAVAGQCPGSDQVSFYAVRAGRLVRLGVDSPVLTPRPWRFECLGGGADPCQLAISSARSTMATVGAWVNPDSLRPIGVAYVVHGGTVTRTPLPLPRGLAASLTGARGLTAPTVSLSMHTGIAAARAAGGSALCNGVALATLCSPPTDALAALADDPGRHPSLLIAARATRGGSIFDLRTVTSMAWRLYVGADPDRVNVGTQPCLLFGDGRALSVSIGGSGGGIAGGLRGLWGGGDGRQAVC